MSYQPINLGRVANDGTGDPIRTAGGKIDANFTEIYDGLTHLMQSTPNDDGTQGGAVLYYDGTGTPRTDAAGFSYIASTGLGGTLSCSFFQGSGELLSKTTSLDDGIYPCGSGSITITNGRVSAITP